MNLKVVNRVTNNRSVAGIIQRLDHISVPISMLALIISSVMDTDTVRDSEPLKKKV